jgi:hypothetical protein
MAQIRSIVVEFLKKRFRDKNILVLCLYCRYEDSANHRASKIFLSLLRQAVEDRGFIPEGLRAIYQGQRDEFFFRGPDEFRKILMSELGTYARVFIVLDALDEYSEASGIREELVGSLQSLTDDARLLVTSRELPSIACIFRDARRLDIHAHDQDVRSYIRNRILRSPRKRLKEMEEEVVDAVTKNVNGMWVMLFEFIPQSPNSLLRFLLARLHMDSLIETYSLSRSDVKDGLRSLPEDVDEAYQKVLVRIEQQSRSEASLAKRVLSFVVCARRPLSVGELRQALAIEPGMKALDPDRLIDDEIWVSVCAGLVVMDVDLDVVRLIRETIP